MKNTYYIKESLKALNKFGKTFTITEISNFDNSELNLSGQDVVVILNPDILRELSDSKLEEYLYNGGHVVLFPNIASEGPEFSHVNNITSNILTNYTDLEKHSLSGNSFQEIDPESIQVSGVQDLFSINKGKGRNIRIFKYMTLPYHPEMSIIELNDGSSVWNRHIINTGILDVFGIAINLEWTNFPIKGAFIPFIHFLIYSQSSIKNNLYKNTGDQWEYILSDYYEQPIYHIHPNGAREILLSNANNIVSVNSLNEPGFHSIHASERNIVETGVNIINKEVHSSLINMHDIKTYLSDNFKIISMEADIFTKNKRGTHWR